MIWIKTAGVDSGMGIVLDGQGDLYVSGVFSNTVTFDTTIVTAVLASVNLIDNFLAKFDTVAQLLIVEYL